MGILTHLKEVVFVIFLGKMGRAQVLRWAHCPEAVKFRSGLTRVEDLALCESCGPRLFFHWAAQGRPWGWRI